MKATVQTIRTVDLKRNDSPLSRITGYLVPAIKSRDGYKDVSLILTAPGCLNKHTL